MFNKEAIEMAKYTLIKVVAFLVTLIPIFYASILFWPAIKRLPTEFWVLRG